MRSHNASYYLQLQKFNQVQLGTNYSQKKLRLRQLQKSES